MKNTFGKEYDFPGWIGVFRSGTFNHLFGGNRWRPSENASLGSPLLLLTLDLSDPRLAEIKGDSPVTELPLLCDAFDVGDKGQRYKLDLKSKLIEFICPPASIIEGEEPLPLIPEHKLDLRQMTAKEIPSSEAIYDKMDQPFLGGDAFVRIGGPPYWVQSIAAPKPKGGRKMKYIAAVGNTLKPGIMSVEEGFFIGEMAVYFFATDDLKEIAVVMQST